MTYDQIRSLIYLQTKTNSSNLPNANLNLLTQPAEDRVASIIMRADSRWQWDDSNQTDLPIATTNIVSGQQDYTLSLDHLTIDRVRVKDNTGKFRLITSVDIHDLNYTSSIDYFNSAGIPTIYDKSGVSLFLGPIPNYSVSGGLEIRFTRGPLKYDYTANTNQGQFTNGTGSGATTDKPGFDSLYHSLVADWASFNYLNANGMQTASNVFAEIQRKENEIDIFYGLRSRDERPRFTIGTNRLISGNESGIISFNGGDSNR